MRKRKKRPYRNVTHRDMERKFNYFRDERIIRPRTKLNKKNGSTPFNAYPAMNLQGLIDCFI